MLPKTLQNCEREMRYQWESLRPMMKDKLEELDYMSRQITREMNDLRIPSQIIDDFLPQQFQALWEEVATEQAGKYGTNGKFS